MTSPGPADSKRSRSMLNRIIGFSLEHRAIVLLLAAARWCRA